MAAVAEDEFDLYGGEDDVYPQPDLSVSATHISPTRFAFALTISTIVRDFKGSPCPYNVYYYGPRPRGG